MTIPNVESNYPSAIDTDANLYLVRDSLRVKLAEDYTVGDTSIVVLDSDNIMSNFPDTGIITLTEQCSDIDLRAINLYYSGKTSTSFTGLEVESGFTDNSKPKNVTNVTLNVLDRHHNAIKNAIIAIQEFVGVEGTIDTEPFGETIEGRLNFLRKLVLTPRAWFSANNLRNSKVTGIVPLEVVFNDESFRLGDGDIVYTWSFGDSTSSSISAASVADTSITNSDSISHTYLDPGYYDVTLNVSNVYGEDTVVFPSFINARVAAPDEAVIEFVVKAGQSATSGSPVGGPYTTPPTIRTPIDLLVEAQIPEGTNPYTSKTYGGEIISGGSVIDPIDTYTWSLGDDLTHANQSYTKALYSEGGIYDLVMRADTTYGSYRITVYEDAIDVVENQNIWLWCFNKIGDPEGDYDQLNYLVETGNVTAYEFGLLSETFKTGTQTLDAVRSESFLDSTNNEYQAKAEFRRNVGFTAKNTTNSASGGTAMMYWAGQGSTVAVPGVYTDHAVKIREFNGFADTYVTQSDISRPWNWLNLNSNTTSYFLFGADYSSGSNPNASYTYQTMDAYNLSTLTSAATALTVDNYKNGASELIQHVATYDGSGDSNYGYFASYRGAWKDSAGYFLRNDNVGNYFRIRSFYMTEGTIADEITHITKLTDMSGPAKLEGELVALSDGLFFFSNTGNISAYNTSTLVWETGGVSSGSVTFRSLQDSSVEGFDSNSNTLLTTTDGDRTAYLSYDYSPYAFIKFSSLDLTVSNVGPRPGWENRNRSQFLMGMF
jgi:PKD repeat protein